MQVETAVVGVHGSPRAARALGRALRGLAGDARCRAGVVVAEQGVHTAWRPTGLDFLHDEPALDTLTGTVGVGQLGLVSHEAELELVPGTRDHARLPPAGRTRVGPIAVAMCGGFSNRAELSELALAGGVLTDGSDAEVLLHLVAQAPQKTPINRLVDALWRVRGGFAAVVLVGDTLVGVRDPRGLRSLVLGRTAETVVIASDARSLDAVGATLVREVEPGEMLLVAAGRIDTVRPFQPRPITPCLLERARLASEHHAWAGRSAWAGRRALGASLARAGRVDVDVVVALPGDEPLATGVASAWGAPMVPALRPDGRVVAEEVAGRTVALVMATPADGAPARDAVHALQRAGAGAVHVLTALPPVRHPCPYGAALPVPDEARAARLVEPDTFASWLGARSVTWLGERALADGVGLAWRPEGAGWCAGCMDGRLPEPVDEVGQLGLFEGGRGA